MVIGTRSAVFAPAKNLGVIIIDEEQDAAYRSEQSPRYHARDVAKYRAAQTNALLVLGSATPSVETYYGAKQGKYPVFTLTERFLGAGLPEVIISDMRGLAREGRSGIIGPDLERELISTLEKGKKAGHPVPQPARQQPRDRLRRVRLGARVPVLLDHHDLPFGVRPRDVPLLRRIHQDNRQVPAVRQHEPVHRNARHAEAGGGAARAVPSARVLRMDADTMTAKGAAHERLLNQFGKGEADILIGTQMVTKGLDFENVTLVGAGRGPESVRAGLPRT